MSLLLKGAALGETVYSEPALRHSHDIDLLVQTVDLGRAAGALARAGFVAGGDRLRSSDEVVYAHRSALPVRLHTKLFRLRHYTVDLEGLWSRKRPLRAAGERAHGLSPADNVLHTLGHASYCPSRSTLLWACDCWLILDATSDLDWSHLVAETERSGLAVPITLMLRYLAEELDSPVPDDALNQVEVSARSASRLQRDLALSAARQSLGTEVRGMLAAVSGVREKLRLASWILFPSADYIRWAYRKESRRRIWPIYLMRPMSIIARRFRSRLSPQKWPAAK